MVVLDLEPEQALQRIAGRGLATLNTAVMFGGFALQSLTGLIIGQFRGADGVAPAIAYQLMFGFLALALAIGLAIYMRKVPNIRQS